MKKIGFIDHYINEWHADNYPAMIRDSSFADKFEVALAWDETTCEGRKSIDQWCAEQGIKKADSIEQIVEECDCIVVLSPDNPERHVDLSRIPLQSGKPVYVDKSFTRKLSEAKQMIELAKAHNTPLMTTSALRYDAVLEQNLKDMAGQKVTFVSTAGPVGFENYSIHQLEPMVMMIGTGAKRIMQCGCGSNILMVIDYGDDRRAVMNILPSHPFRYSVGYGNDQMKIADTMDGFFPRFIEAMLEFLDTGVNKIPVEETLEVAALIEAGMTGFGKPNTWVDVPK